MRSSQHPASYRDPSGFVFSHDGRIYRQVNRNFQQDFELLGNSGLYESLAGKGWLIPHREMPQNLTGSQDWYKTLEPETIPFISYPYEWSFDMLKDAALLTLQIAREAMQHGMMLKDASAYNLQFYEGRMIFIDTLSFEKYEEASPWIAYRQFCEHFFAPLALMHYLKTPLQQLWLAYPDGIPLAIVRKLLPARSKWRLHTYLHLHLAAKPRKGDSAIKNFSRQKMLNLLRSLEEGLDSFSLSEPSGVWSGYYEEAGQRPDYLPAKKKIIEAWARKLNPETVLDAGANEGEFSLIFKNARFIVSADLDHYAVNRLYQRVKKEKLQNLLPVLQDLSVPSPAIGVNNRERASFMERASFELVMALALIHHLSIGHNIPFRMVAEQIHKAGQWLIIEFVPKNDPKVELMLQQKKDVYDGYSEVSFLEGFSTFYQVIDKQTVAGSERTLYLMQRK